jgi:competence protein ComEC
MGVAALVAAACALGTFRGATVGATSSSLLQTTHGSSAVLLGTVRDGTGARRSANQVVVDVERVVHGDAQVDVHGGVLASLRGGPRILPGDSVQLDVTALRAPGMTGPEAALLGQGVEAVAKSPVLTVLADGGPSPRRFLAQMRTQLAAAIDAALPEPAASLVDQTTFAIARALPAELSTALRSSGLAHVLAVSGLKVVLVAGLVGALCTAIAAAPRVRLLATLSTVGGYVALTGASPAAVRSALMAAAGWSLHGSGRTADSLPLLGLVAAAMLLVDPGLCRDVGFQLSFLGTLGIVLIASPLAARLPGPRLFREPFAVTLAAQLATAPVSAATFGLVSLVGPLANALALPLLPPLIALGAVGAGVGAVVPALGFLPLQAAGALAELVAAIAHWMSSLPLASLTVNGWPAMYAVVELLLIATGLAAWHLRRQRKSASGAARSHVPMHFDAMPCTSAPGVLAAFPRGARLRSVSRPVAAAGLAAIPLAIGAGAVLAAAHPDGRLHTAVLDVGAARATEIQTSAGDRALVDTGANPQQLLQSLGPVLPPMTRSLGLLVLTGGDRAAIGGLSGLADRYHVDRAVVPASALTPAARTGLALLADRGTEVTPVADGTAWTWGGASWRLLAAGGASTPGTALHVADTSGSLLVLGNLAADAQDELAALSARTLHADLLVIPPSGVLAAPLADAVRPTAIAIPSARGARASTATLLTGPSVRRTGLSGTLSYADGEGGLIAT